jgi:heme exporter protein D
MIHWNSFADFAAMGGYGLYVWGAYGMTALVLAAELLLLRQRRRRARAAVRQWQVLQGGPHDAAS